MRTVLLGLGPRYAYLCLGKHVVLMFIYCRVKDNCPVCRKHSLPPDFSRNLAVLYGHGFLCCPFKQRLLILVHHGIRWSILSHPPNVANILLLLHCVFFFLRNLLFCAMIYISFLLLKATFLATSTLIFTFYLWTCPLLPNSAVTKNSSTLKIIC